MQFIVLFLILISASAFSQVQFKDEQELVSKIKSFSSESELEKYLSGNDFIEKYSYSEPYPIFTIETTKIDIIHKNLFGDTKEELIVHLSDIGIHSLTIFYYKDDKLVKTPGFIEHQFSPSYGEGGFTFSFEDIYKPDEYCIVVKKYSSTTRTSESSLSIYKMAENKIDTLYNLGYDMIYWGSREFEKIKKTHEFKLVNNTYPKQMLDKGDYSRTVSYRYNDSHDMMEGSVDHRKINYRVLFDSIPARIIKTEEKIRTQIFVNSLGIEKLNHSCSDNATIYLTSNFLYTYVQDTSKIPKADSITPEGGLRYVRCCAAYIKGRNLYIVKKVLNKEKTTVYPLKPPISTLLKPTIKPEKLYCFADTIIYITADSTITSTEDNFIFADHSYVYEFLDNGDIWIHDISSYERVIPFKQLEPYLKPEIAEKLRKKAKSAPK